MHVSIMTPKEIESLTADFEKGNVVVSAETVKRLLATVVSLQSERDRMCNVIQNVEYATRPWRK